MENQFEKLDFETNMSIIKKFYTYLGNFIDVGEYNDPEEVQFLGEYLSEFDNAYEEWYDGSQCSENGSSSEEESNQEYNLSGSVSESDNSSSSLEEKINSEDLNKIKNEVNNKIKNESLDRFISSNNTTDNILLYKKNANLLDRCNFFMESVYQY